MYGFMLLGCLEGRPLHSQTFSTCISPLLWIDFPNCNPITDQMFPTYELATLVSSIPTRFIQFPNILPYTQVCKMGPTCSLPVSETTHHLNVIFIFLLMLSIPVSSYYLPVTPHIISLDPLVISVYFHSPTCTYTCSFIIIILIIEFIYTW